MERDLLLCKALDSLRRDDSGQPDFRLRKSNLSLLVAGGQLVPDEIRFLKDLLSHVSLQTDILARLPLELVILVVDQLDAADIWVMLHVSKQWRTRILSDQVRSSLDSRLFPSLTYGRKPGMPPTSVSTFVGALQIRSQRVTGRFHELSHNDFGFVPFASQIGAGGFSDGMPMLENPVYAHGRLAFKIYDRFAVAVDCFREGARKIFTVPNGPYLGRFLRLEALGDKLVVASLDRYLFAWDLQSGRMERVTLPLHFDVARVATVGYQIVLVTDLHEHNYVWEFGGRLLPLQLPDDEPGLHGGIHKDEDKLFPIIHPQDDHVVFMVVLHGSVTAQHFVTVMEFRDRILVKTYQYYPTLSCERGQCIEELHSSLRDDGNGWVEWYYLPKQVQSDSYGRYSLAQLIYAPTDLTVEHVTRHIVMLQFDIYTKKFSEDFFEIPSVIWRHCFSHSSLRRNPEALVWDNRFVLAELDSEQGVIVHHFRPGAEIAERRDVLGKNHFIHRIFGDDYYMVLIENFKYYVWDFRLSLQSRKEGAPQAAQSHS